MFIILAKKLISNIYKAKFKGGINYAKTKTNKAAKKRYSYTATGKVKRTKANKRHI